MKEKRKVPVTILTGYLGAGKTTLLNKILREEHGKKIAVIENEYGEVGIDQGLVINADEEVFEMSNGCICCTVRGDLIRVLGNLMKRRDKFDYVLVETTGLADPGPVAQTFFMDDEVRDEFTLDGIVTLVDSAHINQQLEHSTESAEQVAFADVLILNKTDLVSKNEVNVLESRLRDMNKMARILRAKEAGVDVEDVLNLGAFDLQQTLDRRPTFLEPEYPFEWTGVYELKKGNYRLYFDDGPDPTMLITAIKCDSSNGKDLDEYAEDCVRIFSKEPKKLMPGEAISFSEVVELQLQDAGQKLFELYIDNKSTIGLFTQHTAEEFNIRLDENKDDQPRDKEFSNITKGIDTKTERIWVAEHEHDDEVGSIALESLGNINPDKLNDWISKLLREKGVDIFRTKGFISYAEESRKIVFQGVHMLFTAEPGSEWGNEPRKNQLVFIGRNLDEDALRTEFEKCLA
jgi:G3E family GTPase